MRTYLDFEKPIAELEGKLEELRHLGSDGDIDVADEASKLEERIEKLLKQTYSKLSAWQKTQVARHPERPHLKRYLHALIDDFIPLAGDRAYAEDTAIVGGLGRFRGQTVMVIGHEKGSTTEERVKHNFGMARPEGYRKARRLMELANQYKIPVVTFVDTAGAYPGVDAEERGQAEAIARSIECCLKLEVPLISIVIGEGGSGGAIAIATGNSVMMMQNAIYSVISPEGCASILWRSGDNAPDAAEALRLTAQDLENLGVIDHIIEEPVGGAHRNPEAALKAVGDALEKELKHFEGMDGDKLKSHRRKKYLEMGQQGLA